MLSKKNRCRDNSAFLSRVFFYCSQSLTPGNWFPCCWIYKAPYWRDWATLAVLCLFISLMWHHLGLRSLVSLPITYVLSSWIWVAIACLPEDTPSILGAQMSDSRQARRQLLRWIDSPRWGSGHCRCSPWQPSVLLATWCSPKTQGRSWKYPRQSENEDGFSKQSPASEQTTK